MSILYLVRHAQASFGSDNYDCLSECGHRQAERLADHLWENGISIDGLYSGTLERQCDTAEAVARRYGIPAPAREQIPAFNEFDYTPVIEAYIRGLDAAHPYSSLTLSDLRNDRRMFQRIYGEAMYHWVDSGEEAAAVCETWTAFQQRCMDGLQQATASHGSGSSIVVVSSAGVISALLGSILDMPHRKAVELGWVVYNTGITEFLYGSRGISLSVFNAVPHLQKPDFRDLITFR